MFHSSLFAYLIDQVSSQPVKTIDDMDFGERKFRGFFMVVGREYFNPNWVVRPHFRNRRPPAHLFLRDKEDKYVQLAIWIGSFQLSENDDDQVEAGNAFLNSFLLGATYEFSSLCSKKLGRTE